MNFYNFVKIRFLHSQGTRKGNAPTIHVVRAMVYSRGIPLAGALAMQKTNCTDCLIA